MTLSIWVNQVFNGWSPAQAFLAGTEYFVVQFAEESVKRGYDVTVYQNGFIGEWNGVNYLPHEKLDTFCDVFLIVKEPSLLDIPFKAKRILYYTNDISDETHLNPKRMEKVEKVFALSKYHRDYFLMGVPRVKVMSHGITISPNTYTRKPFQCVYASSPDRGLGILMQMWPTILKAVPEATLEVAYNGRTPQEMEKLYWESDYWLYPCKGVELYCITGIRAQAHGAYPIFIPTMALNETVIFGRKTQLHTFENAVISMMTTKRDRVEKERAEMIAHLWPTPQSEWEEIMI